MTVQRVQDAKTVELPCSLMGQQVINKTSVRHSPNIPHSRYFRAEAICTIYRPCWQRTEFVQKPDKYLMIQIFNLVRRVVRLGPVTLRGIKQ